MAAQLSQALENLEQVLATAGATMADVVKTTVFLVDMAALPLGAQIEIEAQAYLG